MISDYRNSKVLVTGGLGFIGSSLAVRLFRAGADVTVVDSSVPGCGANPHNLFGALPQVRVVNADIGDAAETGPEIRGCSAIFNVAGEISHIHSMQQPARDAELNAMAQLRFLEECARQAPKVRIVYASTRQIYGAPQYLPVDEKHPVQPVDFNGIHKYAATAYHQLFTTIGKLDALVICLTNVYGPRMALKIPGQGFLGNFIRKALLGQTIQIFGDGNQMRDPVFVDDAVDAFLLAGASRNPRYRLWNLGGPEPLSMASIAQIASSAASAPTPVFRPFPEERKSIDIGSYYSDSSRIRADLGWRARVSFESGMRRTLDYYRRDLAHYLDAADLAHPPEFQALPAIQPQPLPV